MKASSKASLLSPGRARDPVISLSTSLSRRLKTSGSIKNAQASPMFPTGTKKRGSGFENPEPVSPKVTCIGQVRVKTKKQGKKMRNLSRKRSGEVSFRKCEKTPIQRQSSVNSQFHQQECSSHRNQRWVHLPLTICETLRGFGSEFSCLFPCKSSCFSGEKKERVGDDIAKWLVAVQDGSESVKRRDFELLVEDEEDERRSLRRHVFDEIEIKDCDEGGRVSMCIPPKNALLLMRCRSDPVKMEALASKCWEPQLVDEDEEEDVVCNDENSDRNIKEVHMVSLDKVDGKEEVKFMEVFEEKRASVSLNNICEEEADEVVNEEENVLHEESEQVKSVDDDIHTDEDVLVCEQGETKVALLIEEDDELSFVSAVEAIVSEVVLQEESRVSSSCNSCLGSNSDDYIGRLEHKEEDIYKEDALGFDEDEANGHEKKSQDHNLQVELVEKVTNEATEEEESEANGQILETETDRKIKNVRKETPPKLPDCLLLMMCEPKLSMEVSKETWVCSTDFVRWRPQKKKSHAPPHQHKKSGAGDEELITKKRNSVDSKSSNYNNNNNPFAGLPPPAQNQPARSSCSFPAASMATMIEKKLVDAVGYEPFVLSRCKSEPMRTASKLAQEACFWKNRAMIEPHRRGVGAAGLGC